MASCPQGIVHSIPNIVKHLLHAWYKVSAKQYGDVLCVWIIVNAEIWNGCSVHYSGAGLCRVGAVIQLKTLQQIVCVLLPARIIQLPVCWIALDAGTWCLLWRRRTGDYN